ncbi:BCCT family transporter, partial [Vibrio parahaemolyticus]
IFVIFCLALIVSPMGKIRLGGKDAVADYSFMSWLAMLFAAGMGIGLMFWSVAEPVAYFTGWYETPLGVEANTPEAARLALGATMFHWGLHPWAIYGVVALSLAFFAYNKGLPLSMRSIFYPLLGDRAWGWAGHIVDILAVLATLFGLATSLG